jgi:hypothetical protein
MRILVCVLALGFANCAARSAYLPAPETPENLNAAIGGVSLDLKGGACVLSVAIKGAGTGMLEAPREWCEDGKRAKALLAHKAAEK